MGFWARLWRGVRKTISAAAEELQWLGWGTQTASGVVVSQATALQVTTVMACVRIRSQDVAKLPPKVYRVAADGTKTEARDHFLFALFRRPNAWQTWFEFCEFMQVAMLLRGNAYAVVIRNGRGVPLQLVPINPDRVMLYEGADGQLFYAITRGGLHEQAVLRDFQMLIPAENVFHLRWMSADSLLGISPITVGAEAIGLAKSQERHAANLAGNGARPSGILKTDKKLSSEAVKNLKEAWDSVHGGQARTGKTAVLEEGLTFQALTLNSVDMEFIASRKLQVEEICRIFGVSPAKVGVLEGGAGRAFEQIQLTHYSDAVHPDLVRWEQKLETFFDLPDEMDVAFDESELLRADLKSRADSARVLAVSGITTPNEGRRSFGLNPHPDGDVLLVPANVLPIEMAGQAQAGGGNQPGPGSDQTGAPGAGGSGDPAAVEPTG